MRLIELLFLSLLLILPLGELGRIPFIFPNSYVYPNDFIIPVLIFVWIIYRLGVLKDRHWPNLTMPILLFLGLVVLSLVLETVKLTQSEFIVSGLYIVRLVEYIALYFIVADDIRYRHNLHFWLKALLFSAFLILVGGYLQYILFNNFGFMAKYGWDPHVGRLLGSFFDPNFMGGFLSLVLALVLSLLTSKKGYYRGLLTVFAAGLFIAIILTFSRSSYLALAGVVFVIGLFRARWLIVIGTAAFLVALLFIPRIEARITEGPSPGDSAYFRFITWGNALKVFESSPITGVGFNSYRYAQERLNIAPTDLAGNSGAGSDSSSLLVLATTGVLGFSAFLYLLFRIAQLGWRNMRRGGDIGLALLASLAGLALHSQFVNSFFYIWIMAWFWILVGLTEGEREEIK